MWSPKLACLQGDTAVRLSYISSLIAGVYISFYFNRWRIVAVLLIMQGSGLLHERSVISNFVILKTNNIKFY